MYTPFILLLKLHFILMYFIHMDGTITLSQISLLLAPSGIFNFCLTNKNKLFFFSGQKFCHPSLRKLYCGKRNCLQNWLTVCQRSLLPLKFTSSALEISSCSLFACILSARAPIPMPWFFCLFLETFPTIVLLTCCSTHHNCCRHHCTLPP